MNQRTITIYQYALAEGISDADFLKQSEKVHDFLSRQAGFEYRSLAKTENNRWLDVNYWGLESDLRKMDEEFDKQEDCIAFMAMLDQTSICIDRGEIIFGCAGDEAA